MINVHATPYPCNHARHHQTFGFWHNSHTWCRNTGRRKKKSRKGEAREAGEQAKHQSVCAGHHATSKEDSYRAESNIQPDFVGNKNVDLLYCCR